MSTRQNEKKKSSRWSPIVAGGLAAMIVVIVVYPLDTFKTRMQTVQGFEKTGGFRGVYKGLFAAITASVSVNCFFFGSYEMIKSFAEPHVTPKYVPVMHLVAACICRTMSCFIRVPCEIVKQRKQCSVTVNTQSGVRILMNAYQKEGLRLGVYRGFGSTVARDLPYSLIELPSWELLKKTVTDSTGEEITSLQSGICGLIAGGLAGSVTTPVDVAKTRIMLAEVRNPAAVDNLRVKNVLANIYAKSGVRGLFAGLKLRMALIMLGRFIFFGIYEKLS